MLKALKKTFDRMKAGYFCNVRFPLSFLANSVRIKNAALSIAITMTAKFIEV